jgi:hypothetical protein
MAKNVTAINAENTSVATASENPAHFGGFDYTKMNPSTADFLRGAATVIRSCQEGWAREVIRIGTYLCGAKVHLPHGQFGDWLKAEFEMSERTAENYMSVARKFASKSETVSDLPPSLLYKLAAPSTPDTIVAKVIEDIKAGDPVDRQAVLKEINAHRRLTKGPLTSSGRGERQQKSNKADVIAISSPEAETEQDDGLQEHNVREMVAIMAKLGHADLVRLRELLLKPGVLETMPEAIEIAAEQTELEVPDFLDRRESAQT